MRKIFLLNLSLLVLTIIFDQLTKLSAGSFFPVVKNYGLLFNLCETLPSDIKVIFLGTLAGILFFFYLTLTYLLRTEVTKLRYLLSLLMGGILSNTLDKIIHGHTIDFLPLSSYAFNVADIMTTGATVAIVLYLLKHHQKLWPSLDERRTLLINPRAQMMFGLKYMIVALCTSFLMGLLALAYIKNFILPSVLTSGSNILPTFIVLHTTLTLFFSSLVFVIGIIVSHRFVGPIVALERFVDDLRLGKTGQLTLRQGDYFKQLEELSKKISDIKQNSDLE